MKKIEKFSFLKETGKIINQTVNTLIDNLHNDKLYIINYPKLKERFIKEIENYKNHPELIDVSEFSMNYSFGYHSYNNIDDMNSKQAMYIEVRSYLNNHLNN